MMVWKVSVVKWVFMLLHLFVAYVKCAQYSSDEKLTILSDQGVVVLKTGVKGASAIYCNGHEPGMQWVDVSGRVVGGRSPGRRYHVEETPGQLILLFDDLQQVDHGTWTCRAGHMERSVQLIVVEETQFESWKDFETPKIGEDATLMCIARGVPPPQLSWYRNNRIITERTSPTKYEVWKDKLVVHHVNLRDAGAYECRARQASAGWQHTASAITRLIVQHGPIIEGDPVKNVSVLYDHIHVLRCSAPAFPKPSYHWTHVTFKGERVIPDYGRDIATARNGSHSDLTVRVNGLDDLGDYVCTVRNQHGHVAVVFHLRKGTKPDPPTEVVFQRATNDSFLFELNCKSCTGPRNGIITPEDVLGYRFELMEQPLKGLYAPLEPVYWEEDRDQVLSIDTKRMPGAKVWTVRGLRKNTTYVARVASFNLAGPSDFVELDRQFTTTAGACAVPPRVVPVILLLVAMLSRFRRNLYI